LIVTLIGVLNKKLFTRGHSEAFMTSFSFGFELATKIEILIYFRFRGMLGSQENISCL